MNAALVSGHVRSRDTEQSSNPALRDSGRDPRAAQSIAQECKWVGSHATRLSPRHNNHPARAMSSASARPSCLARCSSIVGYNLRATARL
jgi:hypothetical protein